jgi:Zn-dependent protease
MGLISLFFSNPALFFIVAFVLLYSVIFHEVAHGWAALLFGDRTAQAYGRLTLNPLLHIDPIGILMLFLVGFGWAKPVPVNYYNLKNSRLALFCVSLAGCFTNILIAIIAIILAQFDFVNSHPASLVILPLVIRVNIILGAFNLIPIPPLDGSKILMSFLPYQAQERMSRLEPYGFFILVILLFTGVLTPLISFMQGLIYNLILFFFSIFR